MPNFSSSKERIILLILVVVIVVFAGYAVIWQLNRRSVPNSPAFDGELAKAWVDLQCSFGFRVTGSAANKQTADMIAQELKRLGWSYRFQEFNYLGTTVRNILAWQGSGDAILLGAHYDTRMSADAENPALPVPGANDGASGVAVLLELARVIDVPRSGKTIYLAFFDAEDNGRLGEWDWIVGSTYMAQHWGENDESPLQNVIVVDMVGDQDLNIYMERNSNRALTYAIWHTADQLGYANKFIPELKYAILDDHIPFARMDIPAIDIIDFDYPYWHTTQDTPDKVSAESLHIVGTTLETWLEPQTQQ